MNYLKKYKKEFLKNHDWLFCEHCGISNPFRFEIHHIIYKSEMPGHEELNNSLNLILLCTDCHNKFHQKKSLRNKLIKKRELNKLFEKNLCLY